jgi:hypothetical protein
MCAGCCGEWVECSECHDEMFDHQFVFSKKVKLTCKSCRKRFDRDFSMFSTKDKFCNFCGVQWSMPGETPESKIYEECKALLAAAFLELLKPDHPYFSEI